MYSVDAKGKALAFLGSAFPIAPNGWLLTCRHVIDISQTSDAKLAVFDNEHRRLCIIQEKPIICQFPSTDMAILPRAFGREKAEYFPILTPNLLKVGEDVYSYGYFAIGGDMGSVESGYFGGKIVNFFQNTDRQALFTLPYPVIEGMSGSPFMTYHNGLKVVGIATGNRSTRILAAETFEYKDERLEFKETVNRIVEFGTAMHCAAIQHFLTGTAACGANITHGRCDIPGLEN